MIIMYPCKPQFCKYEHLDFVVKLSYMGMLAYNVLCIVCHIDVQKQVSSVLALINTTSESDSGQPVRIGNSFRTFLYISTSF